MADEPAFPAPEEFVDAASKRAQDIIRFGAQVSPIPMDMDQLNESELSCLEVGIKAGIVATMEELLARGIFH